MRVHHDLMVSCDSHAEVVVFATSTFAICRDTDGALMCIPVHASRQKMSGESQG